MMSQGKQRGWMKENAEDLSSEAKKKRKNFASLTKEQLGVQEIQVRGTWGSLSITLKVPRRVFSFPEAAFDLIPRTPLISFSRHSRWTSALTSHSSASLSLAWYLASHLHSFRFKCTKSWAERCFPYFQDSFRMNNNPRVCCLYIKLSVVREERVLYLNYKELVWFIR